MRRVTLCRILFPLWRDDKIFKEENLKTFHTPQKFVVCYVNYTFNQAVVNKRPKQNRPFGLLLFHIEWSN